MFDLEKTSSYVLSFPSFTIIEPSQKSCPINSQPVFWDGVMRDDIPGLSITIDSLTSSGN